MFSPDLCNELQEVRQELVEAIELRRQQKQLDTGLLTYVLNGLDSSCSALLLSNTGKWHYRFDMTGFEVDNQPESLATMTAMVLEWESYVQHLNPDRSGLSPSYLTDHGDRLLTLLIEHMREELARLQKQNA